PYVTPLSQPHSRNLTVVTSRVIERAAHHLRLVGLAGLLHLARLPKGIYRLVRAYFGLDSGLPGGDCIYQTLSHLADATHGAGRVTGVFRRWRKYFLARQLFGQSHAARNFTLDSQK